MLKMDDKIVSAWLTGKFTLKEIASDQDCYPAKVKREIEKYLKSLKKKK